MNSLKDLKAAMSSPSASSKRRDDIRRSVYDQMDHIQGVNNYDSASVSGNSDENERSVIGSLLAYYIRVAGSFSRLNGEILTDNLIAVAGSLPSEDRHVSLESMMFISNHFGQILSAMILNYKNIRNVFANALSRELDLVKQSDAVIESAHHESGRMFTGDVHGIELGVTQFTNDMQLIMAEHMTKSMDTIVNTVLSMEVDRVLSTYTQQDADDIGAILSNPVYLLIAFNNNAFFVKEVMQICEDMMSAYQ